MSADKNRVVVLDDLGIRQKRNLIKILETIRQHQLSIILTVPKSFKKGRPPKKGVEV